ncbi:cobalt-precorrin 5A hydrolase [Paraburkholderia sp. BL23I1N1]|uniref:cobalamin biosynthesis protein n=1 Tax=Paraburkholderia sp. BL23I1N1 TaxID=1938802 RepID=UPI000E719C89|nr:cobalamin biosynthesis protein [Paraburkholderia sp. BL23I1N1]RKE39077.1 cobalt-precorrin 5A hydrolase [Paraburkholderia sp. BL23I1N1]
MKTLAVGIGCRLHSSAEQIETAVRAALGSHAFDEIGAIASIETKAHEAGLLEFCARHALPLKLFSRAQIAAISVDDPSAAAREHLGIDGVCEPCALLAAAAERSDPTSARLGAHAPVALVASAQGSIAPNAADARLLVRKTIHDGITVAIASTTAQPVRAQTNHAPQEQDPS